MLATVIAFRLDGAARASNTATAAPNSGQASQHVEPRAAQTAATLYTA